MILISSSCQFDTKSGYPQHFSNTKIAPQMIAIVWQAGAAAGQPIANNPPHGFLFRKKFINMSNIERLKHCTRYTLYFLVFFRLRSCATLKTKYQASWHTNRRTRIATKRSNQDRQTDKQREDEDFK